ncbi:ABC transporter ATP-binding protein [Tissierellaceae bacterium HCP3S3_D8]
MEHILSVENLSKKYNGFHLKDVGFNIPKGSIVGLVGENGAGKTTTIKLILNLIKRDSGSIKILGLDNIENEKEIKERIGVVLDENYFHDNLRPVDISRIMKSIYNNWNEDIFFEYLVKFKIPKDKIVKEFSKGMKMKLSIAAALCHDPQLLILDEPTGGLDPVVRSEILDIFLDFIQDEEKSILFSTHITSDLDKIADYIIFIHDGKIVFNEDKDELVDNYGIIKCGAEDFNRLEKSDIVGYRKNKFGYEVLVNNRREVENKYKNLVIDSVNLEDIMLFYIRGER